MSTKTTLKRIALVVVSALGFGMFSLAPANAATNFRATYSSPTVYDTQIALVGGSNTVANVGSITVDLATQDSALAAGTDSAMITITAATGADATAQAKNDAFMAALTLSTTVSGTTASNLSTAGTGYNALNNATVALYSNAFTVTPTAANYGTISGRAFLNVARASLAEGNSGGVVNVALTVSNGGVIQTYNSTITLTIGAKLGTQTVTPTTQLATVNAGASVSTLTRVMPYTNAPANTNLAVKSFTLAGTATDAGNATFSVAATATGGAVSCVRSSATVISCTPTKDALTGSMSITYTITVNALAAAAGGQTITVDGFTVTVNPYTPTYNSSTITFTAGSNGYRASAAVGGDGFVWSRAANVTDSVATISVQQVDQNGNNISLAAYAKTVSASITGKGSLSAVTGADVVTKTKTESATNGELSGNDSFTVYSDGTSGTGTLTITVNDATVATYNLRFYGDATSIEATLLRPIGNTAGATNGSAGTAPATRTNNLATAGVTKDVDDDTEAAIAVSVKDANGWVIPTTAPTVTSSNLAVVSGATRLFIDSGVSTASDAAYTAGTFVQHFSYTTLASTSGSFSNLTFTFVNTAGTALASTALKVSVGGAVASTTLTMDKATYDPGAIATLTATAKDASGNKPYDGQDVNANGATVTLSSTIGAFEIVDGVKAKKIFAPSSAGTWTVTLYDASDRTAAATATIRNAADEAKKAADAATTAAEAAIDAASEAIDAANAATDAANLAAEAADAATVAAEEARDAADAATAAVEELATQVATLMAALKAQITTLANTVAKIAKKVKA